MKILEFLVGLVTGIISGFGIGGGSLLILYLTAVAGVNQYTAGGVNLLYFIGCAPCALISHIKNKRIVWQAVLFCTLAGVITSVAAAFLGARMEVGLLRRLFCCCISVRGSCSPKRPRKNPPKNSLRPAPACIMIPAELRFNRKEGECLWIFKAKRAGFF